MVSRQQLSGGQCRLPYNTAESRSMKEDIAYRDSPDKDEVDWDFYVSKKRLNAQIESMQNDLDKLCKNTIQKDDSLARGGHLSFKKKSFDEGDSYTSRNKLTDGE